MVVAGGRHPRRVVRVQIRLRPAQRSKGPRKHGRWHRSCGGRRRREGGGDAGRCLLGLDGDRSGRREEVEASGAVALGVGDGGGDRGVAAEGDLGPRTEVADVDPLFPFLRRSEEHTSELQSRQYLVCRLLLEKKKKIS